MNRSIAIPLAAAALLSAGSAGAGELGHYAPGLLNIRDYFLPADPGVYGAVYNYLYSTDTLKNRKGDEVGTLSRSGPLGTTTLTVEPDIDVYVLAPVLNWVSPWEVLGARYGAVIAPNFATSSVQVDLDLARRGRFRSQGFSTTLEEDTSLRFGDLLVQPVFLTWSGKHYDATANYGFYAPTGEAGIGLDFWTHQFQAAAAWYPFDHKGTAVTLAGTYEFHGKKENEDLIPGDRFTLNWGVSQYLPISDDQHWLAELGVTGYSQWQVSKDSGADVPRILNTTLNATDQVHAAGLQTGLVYAPAKIALTFHYQWEFNAEARFEGQNMAVTLAKGF